MPQWSQPFRRAPRASGMLATFGVDVQHVVPHVCCCFCSCVAALEVETWMPRAEVMPVMLTSDIHYSTLSTFPADNRTLYALRKVVG